MCTLGALPRYADRRGTDSQHRTCSAGWPPRKGQPAQSGPGASRSSEGRTLTPRIGESGFIQHHSGSVPGTSGAEGHPLGFRRVRRCRSDEGPCEWSQTCEPLANTLGSWVWTLFTDRSPQSATPGSRIRGTAHSERPVSAPVREPLPARSCAHRAASCGPNQLNLHVE